MYRKRFKQPAAANKNLVIFLGDSPPRVTWSACSNRIPTFRTNSGKLFIPAQKRWMCPRERLAALGFPVVPALALSYGVPMLPFRDRHRAAQVAGNSMHFGCVLLVQFLALACFTPRGLLLQQRQNCQWLLPDPDSEPEQLSCKPNLICWPASTTTSAAVKS